MKAILGLVLLLLASCASEPASQPLREGKPDPASRSAWLTAQGDWSHAATQETSTAPSPANAEQTARAYFEWARASGVLGEWDQAERLFLTALDAIDPTSTFGAEILSELGQLNRARGRAELACTYFNRALPALQKSGRSLSDPAGYAQWLSDYSACLALTGQAELAAQIAAEARAVIQSHPGKRPLSSPTPYGKFLPAGNEVSPLSPKD